MIKGTLTRNPDGQYNLFDNENGDSKCLGKRHPSPLAIHRALHAALYEEIVLDDTTLDRFCVVEAEPAGAFGHVVSRHWTQAAAERAARRKGATFFVRGTRHGKGVRVML